MRLAVLLGTATLLIGVGVASGPAATDRVSAAPPTVQLDIENSGANPGDNSRLPASGGTKTFFAHATNATSCTYSVVPQNVFSPSIAGFPKTVSCSQHVPIAFPAGRGLQWNVYVVANGPGGHSAPDEGDIDVGQAQATDLHPKVDYSPDSLPYQGGPVDVHIKIPDLGPEEARCVIDGFSFFKNDAAQSGPTLKNWTGGCDKDFHVTLQIPANTTEHVLKWTLMFGVGSTGTRSGLGGKGQGATLAPLYQDENPGNHPAAPTPVTSFTVTPTQVDGSTGGTVEIDVSLPADPRYTCTTWTAQNEGGRVSGISGPPVPVESDCTGGSYTRTVTVPPLIDPQGDGVGWQVGLDVGLRNCIPGGTGSVGHGQCYWRQIIGFDETGNAAPATTTTGP
ncbi:MAG TPA: hypothetical protein VHD91_01700 [Gaiellaceae bacterium]|nr:hypothetical protein [Gaiellaceae bacterium]